MVQKVLDVTKSSLEIKTTMTGGLELINLLIHRRQLSFLMLKMQLSLVLFLLFQETVFNVFPPLGFLHVKTAVSSVHCYQGGLMIISTYF